MGRCTGPHPVMGVRRPSRREENASACRSPPASSAAAKGLPDQARDHGRPPIPNRAARSTSAATAGSVARSPSRKPPRNGPLGGRRCRAGMTPCRGFAGRGPSRGRWPRWRPSRQAPAAKPSCCGARWTNRRSGQFTGRTVCHCPVVYADDPVGRLERASSDLELLLLVVFLKDAAHRAQREYRFVVWAEEEPQEDRVDLWISPALLDAMQRHGPEPAVAAFVMAAVEERSAVQALDEVSRPSERVEVLPVLAGPADPAVAPRRDEVGRLPGGLREDGPARRQRDRPQDEVGRLPGGLREGTPALARLDVLREAVAKSYAASRKVAAAAAWHAEPILRSICSTFSAGICRRTGKGRQPDRDHGHTQGRWAGGGEHRCGAGGQLCLQDRLPRYAPCVHGDGQPVVRVDLEESAGRCRRAGSGRCLPRPSPSRDILASGFGVRWTPVRRPCGGGRLVNRAGLGAGAEVSGNNAARPAGCYPTGGAMPAINPEILVWARETAILTLQDAVAKVGIKDARGVAAVDRLTALERGEEKPTRPVLVSIVHHYRRPLLAFCLNAPPRRDERGPDFRTLPGARSSETDALIDALVRNLQSRQNMVRAALQAEDEAEPLPDTGIQSIRRVLRRKTEAARLSQRAVGLLLGQATGGCATVGLRRHPTSSSIRRRKDG